MGMDAEGLNPTSVDGQYCRVGVGIKDFLNETDGILTETEIELFYSNVGSEISAIRAKNLHDYFQKWIVGRKINSMREIHNLAQFDKFLQDCGGFTII